MQLEAAGHRMVDGYRAVLDDPAAHDAHPQSQLVWGIARLLTDAGYSVEALPLNRYLVEQARRSPAGRGEPAGGDARLRAALVNLGAALIGQGDLIGAEVPLLEAVERCRVSADAAMLQAALGNLAIVRRDSGRTADATAFFAEQSAICRQIGDTLALQASLGNQAQLLRMLGRHDDALAAIDEQEHACRDAADRVGVARAMAARAAVLADRGDISAAVESARAHETICRELGDARGLVENLLNQSVMQSQRGQSDDALRAAEEAEALARQFDDAGLLSRVLIARANAISAHGDWAEVECLAREALLTACEGGQPAPQAFALGLIGTARRELGDLAGCRSAHDEELAVAAACADPQAVAVAHTNLGNLDIAEQRFADALAHYAEAEPVFRDGQILSALLPLLANRGQIHQMQGDAASALADFADATRAAGRLGLMAARRQWGETALSLAYQSRDTVRAGELWDELAGAYRVLGDRPALQRALGERVLMMIADAQARAAPGGAVDQASLATAIPLLDEQEELCRELGDQIGLAACVGNRAIVARYQGDIQRSLALLDQQLAVAQTSGNNQGVLIATANRGEVLGLLGRTDEALASLGSARQVAATNGLTAMVQQLDQMIAGLRAACR